MVGPSSGLCATDYLLGELERLRRGSWRPKTISTASPSKNESGMFNIQI
jgi:hypothetical protein